MADCSQIAGTESLQGDREHSSVLMRVLRIDLMLLLDSSQPGVCTVGFRRIHFEHRDAEDAERRRCNDTLT